MLVHVDRSRYFRVICTLSCFNWPLRASVSFVWVCPGVIRHLLCCICTCFACGCSCRLLSGAGLLYSFPYITYKLDEVVYSHRMWTEAIPDCKDTCNMENVALCLAITATLNMRGHVMKTVPADRACQHPLLDSTGASIPSGQIHIRFLRAAEIAA